MKKIIKHFRQKLPLENLSVVLTYRNIKDCGKCYGPYVNKETGKSFLLIVIRCKSPYAEKVDTLIHEYAHAMVIDKDGAAKNNEILDHSIFWGCCYAKVYRTWLEFCS